MAKKKLDYTKVAQNIIANIGGKENVNSVRHCITRVRFKLKDESKADDNIVKNLEGVISVVHGGGEYMVVLGDAVIDVYDAVCEQLGNMAGTDSGSETKEKVNPVMRLLNIVVGAVGPCLNFICAGGIIKGLLTILEMTGLVQAGSGADALINAAGDAIFFFLPIFLGMNLAKTLMLTNTMMYSFSGLGVFAILGLINPENPNVLTPILCAVVPFVFSFVVAFVLYKDEAAPVPASSSSSVSENAPVLTGPLEIAAPILGKVLPITSVPDETFSTGVLGNGLAIEPSEGKVYSPFDGVCENLADTLHAVGLMSDTGVSLLIHVGLETVGLEGKPFKAHIKTGDRVKKGQLLLEFNMDEIRAAGCPTITSVLVTNEDEVGDAKLVKDQIVIGG